MSSEKEGRIGRASARPFAYQVPSASARCAATLSLLALQVAALLASKSFRAAAVVACAAAGAVCAEAAEHSLRRARRLNAASAIAEGIACGMFFPSTLPFFSAFFITFAAMGAARLSRDERAEGWVNSVALAASLAWISCARSFPSRSDAWAMLRSSVPATLFARSADFSVSRFDPVVASFLNDRLLRHFGASVPEGVLSMLWDTRSVIPAFRFNLLTLVSSIFLFSAGMARVSVPALFVSVYIALVRVFSPLFFGGALLSGDMAFALLTGGTLFSAVFVVQRDGTVPLTRRGRAVYGVLCGALAFLVAGGGMSPAGMAATMLCACALSPLIQRAEGAWNRKALHSMLRPALREEGLA